MEAQQEFFIFASPEIQELLADNRVDISELLQKEGVLVTRGFAQDPATQGDSSPKDLSAVLFASAAVILSLTPTLLKVIATLSHKRVEAQELILVPVEDSQGNVIRNAAGEPILQWVKRTSFIESQKEAPEATSISLKGPMGIELTFSNSPQGPLRLPTPSSSTHHQE